MRRGPCRSLLTGSEPGGARSCTNTGCSLEIKTKLDKLVVVHGLAMLGDLCVAVQSVGQARKRWAASVPAPREPPSMLTHSASLAVACTAPKSQRRLSFAP